jgi:hypothetical protein
MKREVPNVPYLERLRAELLAGIARKRRRTVRRRAALAIGALVLAVPVGVVWPLDTPLEGPAGNPKVALASNVLEITNEDAWIELRLLDPTADLQLMTDELREAGINGRVCSVLAPSPEAVGAWVAVAETFSADGVGVAGDVRFFPDVALSPGERSSPPRVGGKAPSIVSEITAKALDAPNPGAAKVKRGAGAQSVRIRGTGRLDEVEREAPDLIRIPSDFADQPPAGALQLFLGRAPEDGERVPTDVRGSAKCASPGE